jgi:serine/threonine-protein kinase RsbT
LRLVEADVVVEATELPVQTDGDVVLVRQAVRKLSIAAGFSLVDQTKMITAASEIARNTLIHGQGGRVRLEALESHGRRGVRLCFEDDGPGIPDLALALRDGYTTGGGLGLGLGGAKRLVGDFQVESTVGEGTRVTLVRWR